MIQLKNIHKSYKVGKNDIIALKDISLTIPTGNIFGVIGHSGAGKSTLIRCLNLLERPTSGEVWLDDLCLTTLNAKELMHIRRKIGMIFQHFNLLSSQTVFNNIAFPLHLEKRSKQNIHNRVNELLELTGLTEHAHKYPAQLSGGQKQRVGIARALSSAPRVLLCDEATSALDPQTTQSILQLLVDINQKLNLTIVLITHEMEVIRKVCHQVAVIHDSIIIEEGAVEDVFLHPQHQVTQDFIMDANHHDELKNHLKNTQDSHQYFYQITYSGDETYQPHLSDIIHQAGVQFSILSGKISYIRDLPYGQLIVGIKAENGTIDKALALFKARNISATPIIF